VRQERVILIAMVAAVLAVAGYFTYPLLNRGTQAASAQHAFSGADEVPAADIVRSFYNAVGDQRWNDAYALLSPAYRKVSSPNALRDTYLRFRTLDADLRQEDGAGRVVATVKAVDRDDASRQRVFRVVWTVIRVGDGWLIDDKRSQTVSDSGPAIPLTPHGHVASAGCTMPTKNEILNADWGTLDPESGLEAFDRRAEALSIPEREAVGRAVIRSEARDPKAQVFDRLMKVLAKTCRLGEVMAKYNGLSPMEEIDGHNASEAEVAFWVGIVAARYALEARGVADQADISIAYGPYERAIPMGSIPEKHHPHTP
jgi:hypothetical protein